MNSISNFFSRHCKLVTLSTLRMLDHDDDDDPLHFPSDIAELLQICYIGYFWYAWLCTPEVIQ